MDVSYSDLKAYLTCPKQYVFRQERAEISVDRYKRTVIGDILMQVAEAFYTQRWWRQDSPVERMQGMGLELFARWRRQRPTWWLPDEVFEVEKVLKGAPPLMVETIRRERLLGVRNFAELELTLPVADFSGKAHVVHGRVDFVFADSSGLLTVLDGKGGASKNYTDLNQLRLYSLMVEHRWGCAPTRIGFWFFRRGEVEWKTFRPKTLDKLKGQIGMAITGLVFRQFDPTPSTRCRLCDWRLQCPEGQGWLVANAGKTCPMEIPGGFAEVSF